MKIGIDGAPLTTPFPCGTKHYAQELICALAKIDKKNDYVIFSSKYVPIPKQKNFRLVKIPSFIPVLKRQLFLAAAAKKEKLDLFHYLEPYGAVFFRHPKIITTVHDVNLSQTYPFLGGHFFNRIYCEITRKGVFGNSKVFIAVSNFTKEELSRNLKKAGNNPNIIVVNNGLNSSYRVLNMPNVKQQYFLTMGDFTQRKNIPRVINAYSLLPKGLKRKLNLKIVVNETSVLNKFTQLVKYSNIDSYTEIFQGIPTQKLSELYNGAIAFLYPSLYEGFGLPILEAMACGCPVITSNYGAMQETAGDAAYLVDPKSVKGIARAMTEIALKSKIGESLKSKGLKRAAEFSWDSTAANTLAIYRKIYLVK